MTETLDGRPRLGEISEAGVEYKPLSGLAVTGLVFGLLSPLAFVGPMLYIFAIVGIGLSIAALVRIGTDSPAITGRKLALVGLVLSTLCVSMAPSHRLVTQYLLRNEARQFAMAWFRFLGDDEPLKAHQLSRPPGGRLPLDDQLSDVYAEDVELTEELTDFTENAAVRTLLDSGNGAQIQFIETKFQGVEYGNDRVDLLYSVSFEKEGRKQTHFVSLKMIRVAEDDGRASWYIGDIGEHARPT